MEYHDFEIIINTYIFDKTSIMTITPGRIINTIGLILFLYIIVDNYRIRAAFVEQQKKTDSANIASDKNTKRIRF